jgi:mono/diheme cytochrome c family protein
MQVLLVLGPFLVLGSIVAAIAFAGSPGAAREAYLTRGGRAFTLMIFAIYLGLGVAVPAAVIASRGESEGGVGSLRTEAASTSQERGKELFILTCKSCHNLDAVQAHGVTGPDLDELGGVDKQRVLNAIKNGGTGQNRMPSGLLEGQDAQDVAAYVAAVAGQ